VLLVASTPASLLIYMFRSSRRFNTLQFHETVSADKLIMIVYIDVHLMRRSIAHLVTMVIASCMCLSMAVVTSLNGYDFFKILELF